jgi:hypothetical protein
MAEQAGFTNQVFVLAGTVAMTGSTGAKINGVDNSTLSKLVDLLEITQFGDAYKKRKGGLKDTSFSISGNYDPADTLGQLVLIPGNEVMIGHYPQGTTVAGLQVQAIVENFEIAADAAGKQTFTCSLQGQVVPVALPLRP